MLANVLRELMAHFFVDKGGKLGNKTNNKLSFSTSVVTSRMDLEEHFATYQISQSTIYLGLIIVVS